MLMSDDLDFIRSADYENFVYKRQELVYTFTDFEPV